MNDKEQESNNRDLATDRLSQLLKNALPSVGTEPELSRDLWPAMLRHMDEQASRGVARVPWFDWALGGTLLALAAIAPRTIPVILYYL
ncbi:hypothetical protein [Occallatibacter savannae]|uniref:hypothetical protein n=1 Tax=Occallatibacter savannae TaxID=1002691 RepID=UPI000D687147|nr:hypothetical protein [Occallatibacter savannae]